MVVAYIGVGSNLGDCRANIEKAQTSLSRVRGISFRRQAPVYETDPEKESPPQGKFLNTVWEIETELTADRLFDELSEIEAGLGRVRSVKNAPRPIDLDILFFGNETRNFSENQDAQAGLILPHPRAHKRWFVLKPLCDLAPDLVHPAFGRTVRELFEKIQEKNEDN